MKGKRFHVVAACLTILMIALTGCDSSSDSTPAKSAQNQAENVAANRQNYIPKNDVEGKNYIARQKLADDPTSIIWCSVYPTNQNVKPFTVPIVGKLTSGNKRPYSTSQVKQYYQDDGTYSPEVAGPDGMFGTSGEYRYGFDPAGNYYDFYNTETVCTSVPSLIQKQTTDIAITNGGNVNDLDKRAEVALKACRAANPDPSVPCKSAADILGVG